MSPESTHPLRGLRVPHGARGAFFAGCATQDAAGIDARG